MSCVNSKSIENVLVNGSRCEQMESQLLEVTGSEQSVFFVLVDRDLDLVFSKKKQY